MMDSICVTRNEPHEPYMQTLKENVTSTPDGHK